ncbi:MAG: S-layer homology domain-containing protein [Dehalobacterium sp.]
MKYIKKITSMILICTIFLSSTITAFAEAEILEGRTEEELRLIVRGSEEDVEAAPHGRFDFLATQMTTSEDIKSAEITVLRKGGTEGAATVTLKVIDISAEYGKDYVLKVPVGIREKTLPKNSDAPPLMESFGDENSDIDVSFTETEGDEAEGESVVQEVYDGVSEQPVEEEGKSVYETVYGEAPEQLAEELELEEIEIQKNAQVIQDTQTTGLAKAYQNSVGREANKSNWRLSTPDESQKAKEASDRFLSEIEGITYDLTFADGEFMKKLYFCTIDDNVSESDEQVVLTLQNPSAGILGDLNTAYMNIKDNDEFEKPEFAIQDKTVYVSEKDNVARVTLIRTAGLYQYASLIAVTAGITAQEDVDYAATSKELTFVPGVTSQTVEIPLLKREPGEGGDKAFSVMFGEKKDGGFNEELTALVIIESNGDKGALEPSLNGAFLNGIQGGDQPEGETTTPLNTMPLNSSIAVTTTATEKIVTIPRSMFSKGEIWSKGRFGFWPDVLEPEYPQAVYAEYQANSVSTMYIKTNLYGVDQITWEWLNDIRTPITAECIMGFFKQTQPTGVFAFWNSLLVPKQPVMGTFLRNPRSYNLSMDEKFDPQLKAIYFQTKTYNKDRSWLYVYNVKLHYKKYQVEFGNTDETNDSDIWIQPMKITGKNTSVPDGNKIKIGGIRVKDETKGFLGDTITFEPVYNPQIDTTKVYLWGFKVENRTGDYEKEFEGTTLTLDEATIRDLSEKKSLLNNSDTIKVKPIFKQRTHFVQVKFEKAGSGISGFKNLDDMMLNAYDTISLSGYAKAPDYAAGYLATGYNRSDKTPENLFPYRPFDISAQINPANPGKIDRYKPSHDRELLTMLYGEPELNVKYHPVEGKNTAYNDRGEVAVSEGESAETGRYDTPILVKPLTMDKTYQLIANPVEDHQVWWYDFTGDMDGDGVLSPAEKLALGDGKITSIPLLGNTFYYRPVFPSTNIYYTFKPKSPDVRERMILGNVFFKGGTVLDKNGVFTPIEGAAVTVGNDTVYTDETGFFISKSTDYQLEGLYSLKINYKDFDFISQAQVSAAGDHIINAFDTLVPEDFKIYKTLPGESEKIVKPGEVDNGGSSYRFTFRTKSTLPTVKAAKATIRIYSKDGQSLRKEYEVNSNSNDFELKMVPSDDGILPGDYMTLQLTDNDDVTYFENKVGFDFIRSLDTETFNFIQSFRTPITPVLDLFGKVNLVSDIGLAGNVTDYFTRTGNELTMNIGFSKAFQSVVKTIKAEDVEESSESPKKQKETTDSAVAKDGDSSNYKRTAVTRNIGFNVACAISVVMELDADINSEYYGEFYFKQMVLMGSIGASYGKKYEYMTPLGIPVFITWELAGEVSITYLYEQYDNKKFYFNEEKPINLANSGTNNTNRDFTMTGKYFIRPSITLGAGVGYDLLNVSLNGCAAFELNFTSLGQGSGDIVLSANIKIKILFFTKSWGIGKTSFGLFDYGRMSYALFDNKDYRYDSIDTLAQLPRDYLAGRTPWNGSANKSRLLVALDGIAEQTLQAGSYPHPETKMVKFGDEILMVFIDDDGVRTEENRTTLKYSKYDGSDWSVSEAVYDDGTLDCQPNLFDLGDKILLTWSNGDKVLPAGSNVIDTLSSLNIFGTFFDKETGEFGDVSQITKTTREDITADTMPTVAYDGETEKLILYYTKTEYAAPTLVNGDENEETEALVGDVLNGFSLIAYTFYDDKKGWKSSYTEEEKAIVMDNADPPMTEEEFLEYEANWYGQQFLDLAPQIEIDESGITGNDDYWQEGKTPTVTAFLNDKAKVLESAAISYNQLSLFAYVLDTDGDEETFADQDIYLQIYDFQDNIFTHPIQITNDGKKDANIRFIRNDGETYLYFISGGDIKYTNISSIVKTGLIKEGVNGREFYILDKSFDSGYEGTVTVVKQKEDNPLSEFEVQTDNTHNIYVVWPEILTTYREGIDPTSEEATLPENQYRETQIFIARYSYGEEELIRKVYDGEGEEIPRETKKETIFVGNWSLPVQYTHEKGANLTELNFVIMDDGTLKAVYNKSYSIITDENHIAHDEDNTMLMTADFIPSSQILISSDDIAFTGDVVRGDSQDYIGAKVINDGLETLKGYKVKIYQGQNDVKTLLSESPLGDFDNLGLPGGSTAFVGTAWQVPENIDGLYIEIVVEDEKGFFVAAAQKSIESKTVLELSDLEADLTDVDTATVAVTVTNRGNIPAERESFYIYANDVNVGLSELDLAIGESKRINMDVDLSGKFTSATDEQGNITERAEIKVMTRDASLDTTLERTAAAGEIELMGLLSNIFFKNQKLSLKKGREATLLIEAEKTFDIGGETKSFDSLFDIVWKSSNENVARVFNDGSIVAVNKGAATISAYVLPKSNTYYATNLTNPFYITGLEAKARAAVKHLEAEVLVDMPTDEPNSDGKKSGSKKPESSIPVPGNIIAGITGKTLITKAYTPQAEEDIDCLVMVDQEGNIIPYSYYDAKTGLMMAWVDEPLADYQIRSVKIDFTDISGRWYEEAVQYLAARNIITGVGENRFQPDANIKRGDFVLLLVRLLGLKGDTGESFDDVHPGSYYANAISVAKQRGIILGGGEGSFYPEREISRQDMFTIVHRVLTMMGINSGPGVPEAYTDAKDIAGYAQESVDYLSKLNLVQGFNGAINPLSGSKRSETAQFIYNIFKHILSIK